MNQSTDYHDYVFHDGKLVGEFEEMYSKGATTPWHQDEQENWIDVRLTKQMLQDLGRFSAIHDFGCSTGHYLDLMAKHSLATNGKSYGYDVSAAACEKAASIFPHSSFSVLDLTQRTTNDSTFHDTGDALVRISETGRCDRKYCQSNAALRSASCDLELPAAQKFVYRQGCFA